MNKKDIILIVGVVLIVIITILVTGSVNDKNKVELPLTLSDTETGVISLDYDTYSKKVKNKDKFIVVVEKTGCTYCESYAPVVKDVANKYSIPIYDINIAELSSEEYVAFGNSNSYLRRNKWGTPTTLLLSGDYVVNSISGYVEEEVLSDFIESNIKLSLEENNDVE